MILSGVTMSTYGIAAILWTSVRRPYAGDLFQPKAKRTKDAWRYN